ncbi:hypothetical protein JCM17960_14270 [Magnetospira thiophila]
MSTNPGFRLFLSTAFLGVLACLLLMGLRIDSSFSTREPLQLITSGWEQQPLYDIWRAVKGMPLYTDVTRIPYAIAFYNWGFYAFYGELTALGLRLLDLGDAWLPTVARFITLAGCLFGVGWTTSLLRRTGDGSEPTPLGLALPFALLLFFGPLVGFWGFTVRPDIWAMALEILGLLLFWRNLPRRPLVAVGMAALLFYGAWSFKHVNVTATVTVALYLLATRRWGLAMLFSALLFGAYGLTFVIGGPLYFSSLFQTAQVSWNLAGTVHIFVNWMVKATPVLLPLAALLLLYVRDAGFRRDLHRAPSSLFLGIGVFVSFLFMLPGTAKEGAAENYYFMPMFFLLAATHHALVLALQSDGPWRRLPLHFGAAGWSANIAAIGLVLGGVQGVISVDDQHQLNSRYKACIADLPKPTLTDTQYLSLPWMNLSEQAFILNYNYPLQRAAGVPFERGGIGGLVEEGYFASIALSHDGDSHDGGRLTHYTRQPLPCAGLTLWLKNNSAG